MYKLSEIYFCAEATKNAWRGCEQDSAGGVLYRQGKCGARQKKIRGTVKSFRGQIPGIGHFPGCGN